MTPDGVENDPNWKVGYPYKLAGTWVTIFKLNTGWGWMDGSGGCMGMASEKAVKRRLVDMCLRPREPEPEPVYAKGEIPF